MPHKQTLEQWLQSRSERVPEELQERVRVFTHDIFGSPAEPQLLADVAHVQLDALVKTGVTSRNVALDLLTVDAIATYALELAAATGADITATSASIMESIARLMDPPDSQPELST